MKNLKILLLLITFSSISQAEIITNMFLRENVNRCVYDDFYYKYDSVALKHKFYYRYAGKTSFNSSAGTRHERYIYSGYEFDTDTLECRKSEITILGMSSQEFYFLMGLSGVIFSTIVSFVIATFLTGL